MKLINSLLSPQVQRDVVQKIWNDGKNAFRVNHCLTILKKNVADQEEDETRDDAHHEATGLISLLNLKLSLL